MEFVPIDQLAAYVDKKVRRELSEAGAGAAWGPLAEAGRALVTAVPGPLHQVVKAVVRPAHARGGHCAAGAQKAAHGIFWFAFLLVEAGQQPQLPRLATVPASPPLHTACQVLVDLTGVVTEVRPLGSVKRKTDQVELSRRDVTLVDQRSAELTTSGCPACACAPEKRSDSGCRI